MVEENSDFLLKNSFLEQEYWICERCKLDWNLFVHFSNRKFFGKTSFAKNIIRKNVLIFIYGENLYFIKFQTEFKNGNKKVSVRNFSQSFAWNSYSIILTKYSAKLLNWNNRLFHFLLSIFPLDTTNRNAKSLHIAVYAITGQCPLLHLHKPTFKIIIQTVA